MLQGTLKENYRRKIMYDKIELRIPLTIEAAASLRAGDMVYLTGAIYTARDAAHQRLFDDILAGRQLPFDFNGAVVYYAGPCPAKPGKPIGSVGPTTAGRMDKFSPLLIEQGLRFMIGKGLRDQTVIDKMVEHGGIYFAAIGGAAALMAKCVVNAEIIAYPELGTEAVRKLEVKDFPAIVAIDSRGVNYYDIGRKKYEVVS